MKITFRFLKPEPRYKIKKLAEAAIEFNEGILIDIRLIGFTIHEDASGLFVMFPSYIHKKGEDTITFSFLRAMQPNALNILEDKILDEYERQLDAQIDSKVEDLLVGVRKAG
jgi:hypothetical protein